MEAATILVVCTGNVRRSPAIAAILRHGTESARGLDGTGISVISAGVGALLGDGIEPLIATELGRLGVSAESHRARAVIAEQIERADLILTAERAHRSEVVRVVPSAVRRTFTLLEFAALGGMVPRGAIRHDADIETRLRELVRLAPLERARRIRTRADADDLADIPHVSQRSAARLVRQLHSATETVLHLLDGNPALSLVTPTGEFAAAGPAERGAEVATEVVRVVARRTPGRRPRSGVSGADAGIQPGTTA